MSTITVIGSLNMDIAVSALELPIIGKTVLGDGFLVSPGGKGANQAVAAAGFGGDVTMIGCVGNDSFGRDLINHLDKNKVNTSAVSILNDTSTGVAVVVVHNGDNFIIVDAGANFGLKIEDIAIHEDIIKKSNILLLQFETPLDVVMYSMILAKKHKVRILFNPAPVRDLCDEMIAMIDICVLNETECEAITGIQVNNVIDAKRAVEELMRMGIEVVLVTLGGEGVVYNSGSVIVHQAVPKVEVVDTTAAGDCFIAALAVALTEGKDIDQAVEFAKIAGTLTVTKKGAQCSLPDRNSVENFIRQTRIKCRN